MSNKEIIESLNFKRGSAYELAVLITEEHQIKCIDGDLCIYKKKYNYWLNLKNGNYDKEIRLLIPEGSRGRCNHGTVKEIIYWLDTLVEQIHVADIPERNQYLNFRNQCINVLTLKRKKHTPELYFRHYINADIPPEEGWPSEKINNAVYTKFLKGSLESKFFDLKDDFEELIGLILSPQRTLKIASIFWGSPNTGKSVALNLLSDLMGGEFVSYVSFSQFSEEFAVANLAGKALNISGEISGIKERRLDLFNSVVGNDKIMACFKGKDYFELRNNAFLAFACNELPMLPAEMVDAFCERVVIFPFYNVIPRQQWIENINAKMQGEFELICAMAIMGLARFINNGNRFTHQDKLDMIKAKAMYRLNSFRAFAKENLVADVKAFTSSNEIETAYKEFCNEYDLDTYSSQIWSRYLRQTYPLVRKVTRKNSEGVQCRGYEGVKLSKKVKETLETKIFGGCQ